MIQFFNWRFDIFLKIFFIDDSENGWMEMEVYFWEKKTNLAFVCRHDEVEIETDSFTAKIRRFNTDFRTIFGFKLCS